MKQTDRIVIYVVGFALGTLLVSTYFQFKERQQIQEESETVFSNARLPNPLPDSVPAVFSKGSLIDYVEIQTDLRSERIWLLQFKKSYPFVRIVQDRVDGSLKIMAADQILVHLNEGTDVTDLKEQLATHNLKVRMFNRNENIVVIGVLNRGFDAVPQTLELVSSWTHWVQSAVPDYIEVRTPKEN
jgi:hypothetical protein